ncbi:hypothetical protein [Acidiphilium cryptum]|uniref:Uncharacterized protein n=1 Tax=Acidiphilium cryptum (strain JF-5) TaxID=349163 RepID=A5FUQ7_ACICJ|nr:hypothetical protein [Acidiphilium cryptum]ABQ29339.1 hypothetical protein Acry_0111 [Acidiphilium cryptum JF-5]
MAELGDWDAFPAACWDDDADAPARAALNEPEAALPAPQSALPCPALMVRVPETLAGPDESDVGTALVDAGAAVPHPEVAPAAALAVDVAGTAEMAVPMLMPPHMQDIGQTKIRDERRLALHSRRQAGKICRAISMKPGRFCRVGNFNYGTE